MVRSRRDYFIGNTYFFLNLWFLPEICFFTITMWPYLFHDTLLAAMVPLRVKTFGGLSPFRFFNEHFGCEHRHHPFVTVDDWLTRKFSHLSTLWSFSFHGWNSGAAMTISLVTPFSFEMVDYTDQLYIGYHLFSFHWLFLDTFDLYPNIRCFCGGCAAFRFSMVRADRPFGFGAIRQ